MAAGGSRRRRPWWRRCGARRRPRTGGKGEGDLGGSIAPLTSGRGDARRRLRGGGVGSSGRRSEVAVGVVVVGKWRRGLFIGVEGGGEEGTRQWPAGGLGGAPLMAWGGLLCLSASRSGVSAEGIGGHVEEGACCCAWRRALLASSGLGRQGSGAVRLAGFAARAARRRCCAEWRGELSVTGWVGQRQKISEKKLRV